MTVIGSVTIYRSIGDYYVTYEIASNPKIEKNSKGVPCIALKIPRIGSHSYSHTVLINPEIDKIHKIELY